MRLLVATIALSACYSPQLDPCAVHCDGDTQCPGNLACGLDLHCHAPDDTSSLCPNYRVTVNKLGTGTGLVTGDFGIDCGIDCEADAVQGQTVMLTATNDTETRFAGWTGPCTGTDACSIRMIRDQSVTAEFTAQRQLTVRLAGSGTGQVMSEPQGIYCKMSNADCIAPFDRDSMVTLTATPDVVFFGWESGPCSSMSTSTCVVTMADAVSVTAHFE